MRLLKPCKKFVASSATICFFASLMVPSPVALAQPEGLPIVSSFVPLGIPSELAKIEEAFIPNRSEGQKASGPSLIHIQSVHAHPETQKKIYALLKFLDEKYGIDSMFIEGAGEKLNPDYFRFFEDNRLNVRVAEKLVEKGELTGAELFLIESPRPIPAHGIEDPALYQRNLTSFQYVIRQRPVTAQFTKGLRSSLGRLETLLLEKEARKLLRSREAFDSGQMELLSYALELERAARAILGIDIRYFESQLDWPEMIRLLRLQEVESKLDPEKIQAERQSLVNYLKGAGIDRDLVQGFENLSFSPYQSGMVYDPGFRRNDLPRYLAERLVGATLEKGFAFEQYPDFTRYLEAAILQSELEAGRLFQEIERLFDKIMSAVSGEAEDKKFVGLVHKERLYERLFNLELTPKDYAKIQTENLEERPLIRFLVELEALHERTPLGKRKLVPSNSDTLESIFGEALRFYELAKQRESVMVDKILSGHLEKGSGAAGSKTTSFAAALQSRRIGAGVTVLITGGFHTAGLSHTFREKQIPYTILTPRITEKVNSEDYVSALLGKKQTAFDTAHLEDAIHFQGAEMRFGRMWTPSTRQAKQRSEVRVVLEGLATVAHEKEISAGKLASNFSQSLYGTDRRAELRLSPEGNRLTPFVEGKPLGFAIGTSRLVQESFVPAPVALPLSRSELRALQPTAFQEKGTLYDRPDGTSLFVSDEELDIVLSEINHDRTKRKLGAQPLDAAKLQQHVVSGLKRARPSHGVDENFWEAVKKYFRRGTKPQVFKGKVDSLWAPSVGIDGTDFIFNEKWRLVAAIVYDFPNQEPLLVDVASIRNARRLTQAARQAPPQPEKIAGTVANFLQTLRHENKPVLFLSNGRYRLGEGPLRSLEEKDAGVQNALAEIFKQNPTVEAILFDAPLLKKSILEEALKELAAPYDKRTGKKRADKEGFSIDERYLRLEEEKSLGAQDQALLELLWSQENLLDRITQKGEAKVLTIGPAYLDVTQNFQIFFTPEGLQEIQKKASVTEENRAALAGILKKLFETGPQGHIKRGPLHPLMAENFGGGEAGSERVFLFPSGEAAIFIVGVRRHTTIGGVEGQKQLEEWAGEIQKGSFHPQHPAKDNQTVQEFLRNTLRLRVVPPIRSELRHFAQTGLTAEQRRGLDENAQVLFDFLAARETYDVKADKWELLEGESWIQEGSFDLVIVFGSSYREAAEGAAKIAKKAQDQNPNIIIIPSGRGPVKRPEWYRPYTLSKQGVEVEVPEAEFFADQMLKAGVGEKNIIPELKATNTGENTRYVREIVDKLRREGRLRDDATILLLQNGRAQKRGGRSLVKQFNGGKSLSEIGIRKVVSLSPFGLTASALNEATAILEIQKGIDEIRRFPGYAEQGFMDPIQVPEEVSSAIASLQAAFPPLFSPRSEARAVGEEIKPLSWINKILLAAGVTVFGVAVSSLKAEPVSQEPQAPQEVDQEKINQLMEKLKNGKPDEKVIAAAGLGEIAGPEIIPYILPLLKNDKLGPGRMFPSLGIMHLARRGFKIPEEVRLALEGLAEDTDVKADGNEQVVVNAIRALREIGDPRSIPVLEKQVASESLYVAWNAAQALGNFHEPEAFSILVKTARDEKRPYKVRYHAMMSLREMGDPKAIPVLKELLKDKDKDIRKDAEFYIGEILEKVFERTLGNPKAMTEFIRTFIAEKGFRVKDTKEAQDWVEQRGRSFSRGKKDRAGVEFGRLKEAFSDNELNFLIDEGVLEKLVGPPRSEMRSTPSEEAERLFKKGVTAKEFMRQLLRPNLDKPSYEPIKDALKNLGIIFNTRFSMETLKPKSKELQAVRELEQALAAKEGEAELKSRPQDPRSEIRTEEADGKALYAQLQAAYSATGAHPGRGPYKEIRMAISAVLDELQKPHPSPDTLAAARAWIELLDDFPKAGPLLLQIQEKTRSLSLPKLEEALRILKGKTAAEPPLPGQPQGVIDNPPAQGFFHDTSLLGESSPEAQGAQKTLGQPLRSELRQEDLLSDRKKVAELQGKAVTPGGEIVTGRIPEGFSPATSPMDLVATVPLVVVTPEGQPLVLSGLSQFFLSRPPEVRNPRAFLEAPIRIALATEGVVLLDPFLGNYPEAQRAVSEAVKAWGAEVLGIEKQVLLLRQSRIHFSPANEVGSKLLKGANRPAHYGMVLEGELSQEELVSRLFPALVLSEGNAVIDLIVPHGISLDRAKVKDLQDQANRILAQFKGQRKVNVIVLSRPGPEEFMKMLKQRIGDFDRWAADQTDSFMRPEFTLAVPETFWKESGVSALFEKEGGEKPAVLLHRIGRDQQVQTAQLATLAFKRSQGTISSFDEQALLRRWVKDVYWVVQENLDRFSPTETFEQALRAIAEIYRSA